ncbi:MAG: hybrid sensor histidine kinase/response regulator [Myxococcota bacterium]
MSSTIHPGPAPGLLAWLESHAGWERLRAFDGDEATFARVAELADAEAEALEGLPDGEHRWVTKAGRAVLVERSAGTLEVAVGPASGAATTDLSASVLAAGAAHELANALGAIVGWAERLGAGSPAPEAREGLALMASAAKNAQASARELLATAAGRPAPDEGPPCRDLRGAAEEVARLLQLEARSRGVRVQAGGADGVGADLPRHQAFAVLWNLTLNAVQVLGAHEGGRVDLVVGLDPAKRSPVVEIRDDGPGLPPDLTDPFRAFASGRSGGTGLGLHLVDRTVRAAGGTLAVRAGEGGGTVFRVTFPRLVEAPRESERRVRGTTSSRPRVLVVEDDLALRELVSTSLELRGYAVTAHASAAPLLPGGVNEAARFGIALIDLSLPDARGDDLLLTLLRGGRVHRSVLMTGDAAPRALVTRADQMLRKPFTPGELVDTVDALAAALAAAG